MSTTVSGEPRPRDSSRSASSSTSGARSGARVGATAAAGGSPGSPGSLGSLGDGAWLRSAIAISGGHVTDVTARTSDGWNHSARWRAMLLANRPFSSGRSDEASSARSPSTRSSRLGDDVRRLAHSRWKSLLELRR
jgi:hypothetical protein